MRTEKKLFEMFQENTGTHMLDSGQDNNRYWQKNQKLKLSDFMKRERFSIDEEGYNDDDCLTEDTYKMLVDNLDYSASAQHWNNVFNDWKKLAENKEDYELSIMEKVIERHNQNKDMYNSKVYNSYNEETALTQTIQYGLFEHADKVFIILQIHGGADVRGGYTDAVVFEVNDIYLDYISDYEGQQEKIKELKGVKNSL